MRSASGSPKIAQALQFRSILFGGLFLVVAASMLALGGNRPLPWTGLSLAAFVACGLALFVRDDAASPGQRAYSAMALPAALYLCVLIWGLWQTAIAPPGGRLLDVDNAWATLMRMAAYAAVFFVAFRTLDSLDRARRLVDTLALSGAALCVFGIGAFLSGVNPILDGIENRPPGRLSASFVNPNSFAFVAGLTMLANLAAYDRRLADALGPLGGWRDAIRALASSSWIYMAGLVAAIIALALTSSRGGALAAAIGVVTYFALRRDAFGTMGEGGAKRVLVLVGLALFGIGLFLGADKILGRLADTNGLDVGRMELYASIGRQILEHPVAGVGIGAFEEAMRPHIQGALAQARWDKAHSLYLEYALELGLPALALWGMALILIGRRLFAGALRRHRGKDFLAFACAVFVAGAAHSLIDFPLQMPSTAAVFAMILGAGWANAWPHQRRRPSKRSAEEVVVTV